MTVTHPHPQAAPPPSHRRFPELSVVALVRDLDIDGRKLPSGSRGTVVSAYTDGSGYEVEFDRPFHTVVTLDVADLTA